MVKAVTGTKIKGHFRNWSVGRRQRIPDDSSFWKVGSDVRDDLSMLPRKIALTVRCLQGD